MPAIWLIDAYRAGERGQVHALTGALENALGWPVEIKKLAYRKHVVMPHVLGLASISGITDESRLNLLEPWPDLVIASGVRNEPVCRWIREQSGGRTRYVHVGRPWGSLDSFDAVVTTPQYRVPHHSAVVQNMLTLHSVTRRRLNEAAVRHSAITAGLPGPHTAVVIGGDSGPFTFGPKAARRLALEVSAQALRSGGSLLITTSARTDPAAVLALRDTLTAPNFFYPWRANDEVNPYLGILGLADNIVVTGDSIAMLSEACATSKPVQIFDIGGMRNDRMTSRDFRVTGVLYDLLLRWGWQPLSRDITLVHQKLVESGWASWLGEALPEPAQRDAAADMNRAVAAVKKLFGQIGVAGTVEQ